MERAPAWILSRCDAILGSGVAFVLNSLCDYASEIIIGAVKEGIL